MNEWNIKYKIIGYIVFFIACLLFALYIQFPAQLFADYIENRISKSQNISAQISSISPSLPFGMQFESIILKWQDEPVVKFDNTLCTFQINSLLSSNKRVQYKANVFNGMLSGIATFEGYNTESLILASLFENIMIENLNTGIDLLNCKVSGLLNGQMELSFNKGQLEKTEGTINLKNLLMDFSEKPLYSIEKFAFSSAQLNFTMLEKRIIRIEKLQMKGRQMDINVSGDIMLAQKTEQSRLNLESRITLYPLFFMNAGKSLPIDISRDPSGNALFALKIGGTLQNPRIRPDISIDHKLKTDKDVKI